MRGQSLLNFWEGCSFDSLQDVGDVLVLLGLDCGNKEKQSVKEGKIASHI